MGLEEVRQNDPKGKIAARAKEIGATLVFGKVDLVTEPKRTVEAHYYIRDPDMVPDYMAPQRRLNEYSKDEFKAMQKRMELKNWIEETNKRKRVTRPISTIFNPTPVNPFKYLPSTKKELHTVFQGLDMENMARDNKIMLDAMQFVFGLVPMFNTEDFVWRAHKRKLKSFKCIYCGEITSLTVGAAFRKIKPSVFDGYMDSNRKYNMPICKTCKTNALRMMGFEKSRNKFIQHIINMETRQVPGGLLLTSLDDICGSSDQIVELACENGHVFTLTMTEVFPLSGYSKPASGAIKYGNWCQACHIDDRYKRIVPKDELEILSKKKSQINTISWKTN